MAVDYKPHAKQIAAHRAFMVDGYKRGTLFWGRQVGKTMWSVYHSWMSAMMKQGQYFIVFRTYSQASQVVWKQYKHVIPQEIISHVDNDELRITFKHVKGPIKLPGIGWIKVEHDPNKPPSTLRLLGSDQAESHRGNKAHGIIFDEYADQNPDNWEEVYKYFFTTTEGWACFMGTPKGYNHWYDMLEYAKADKKWYYSRATWRDNPAINPAFVANERQEADKKGTLNAFLQEMELEFRAVQGSVYPMFKRDIHVVKPSDVPTDGTDYVTIDFGWATDHPMAVNFVRVDIEDRWWVYDEIHVTETDLKEVVIPMIKAKMADRRITLMVADEARPDLIEICIQAGLPCIPVSKKGKTVASGISLLGARMKPRIQLMGTPQPQIYFTSNCRETILEFEQYKYAQPKKERPVAEEPIKKYDNHPDGLRYLALQLKYGRLKDEKPPTSGLTFDQYGLLMQ